MHSLLMADTKQAGGRRKDPNLKQLNLVLHPDLIRRLKIKSAELELNLSEIAEKVFTEWLDKNDK